MQTLSISPGALLHSLATNRGLIATLVKREVFGRYRGSILGVIWSLIHPLLMLGIYTFVFGVVLGSRWSGAGQTQSQSEFALVLYAGLIIFNLFSECLTRSTTLILSHPNYVKKLPFPLEILPTAVLGSALFNLASSFVIWLIFHLFISGLPNKTILLVPVILVPLCAFSMGVSWFLASISVYLRDVTQIVGILSTALLFLSAIFYPVAALPEEYQPVFAFNPLAVAVEEARKLMIWGELPDPGSLVWLTAASFFVGWLGFVCFQKLRRGFADVI